MHFFEKFFAGKQLSTTSNLVERARIVLCFRFIFIYFFILFLSFPSTVLFHNFDVMLFLAVLLTFNVIVLFSLRGSGYKIAAILQAVIVLAHGVGNSMLASFNTSIVMFIWPLMYTFFLNFMLGNRATVAYLVTFVCSATGLSLVRAMHSIPLNPIHDERLNYVTGVMLAAASFFMYHFITIYDKTRNEIVKLQLDSLESRDNIIHMVGHDLRNTIGAGIAATELIELNMKAGDSNAVKRNLRLFKESTENSLAIVNELMESASVPTAEDQLNITEVDLTLIVRRMVDQFMPVASNKSIEIAVKAATEECKTGIDVDKIKRVFGNLLSNAIKFTYPGGKIVVSLKSETSHITVSFKDTGIGIAEELQKQLFQKFTKAGRRGTHGERSIGLGMYIVKSILDLHHVSIDVVSEENKGSAFTLVFPRTSATAQM